MTTPLQFDAMALPDADPDVVADVEPGIEPAALFDAVPDDMAPVDDDADVGSSGIAPRDARLVEAHPVAAATMAASAMADSVRVCEVRVFCFVMFDLLVMSLGSFTLDQPMMPFVPLGACTIEAGQIVYVNGKQ